MIRFSANLNKVALVRNARDPKGIPDIVRLAAICLNAGAGGITLHPRPDRRHALAEDAGLMQKLMQTSTAELNLEGNPFSVEEDGYPGFMGIVRRFLPDQCTLVPDGRDQLTSDSGWPLDEDRAPLKDMVAELKALRCRVSLFIDADPRMVERAAAIEVDAVELYTGPWAKAWNAMLATAKESAQQRVAQLHRVYTRAAEVAVQAGLDVHAGHDLNLRNLGALVRLPGLKEVSIGQALVGDALEFGMDRAVKNYLEILGQAAGEETLPLDLPL